MAIYLLRHGETTWNAARILQLPDTPLSDRGREQAERLAARLADVGIARILCSDYLRTRMTAAPLVERTGAPIEIEPLLRERNFGDHRGSRHADLEVDVFAAGYAPPNGESPEVFEARVAQAWERVLEAAARTDGHLAVVSHGLVCRVVAREHVEVPAELAAEAPQWINTCVTVVEPPARVTRLACVEHLDGMPALGAVGAA